MPIYEYICNHCEHELEVLQSIKDPPLTVCPACGRAALRKKLSVVAFRLKGTGWYETDFKNAANGQAKGSEPDKGKEAKSDSETANSNSAENKSDSATKDKSKSGKPAADTQAKSAATSTAAT